MFTAQHGGEHLGLDHPNFDNDSAKLIHDLKRAGYKRLMIVRVDLLIREEYQRTVSIFEFQEYKNRLWSNRRSKPSIFRYCLGWIWGLEYTEQAGYHCHTVFIFDADLVQQDIYYADQIGNYWINAITHGKGCYHNCNRHKSDYKHCGIGKVSFSYPEQNYNLCHHVIPYLAKDDPLFRNAILLDEQATGMSAGKVRSFGHSNNLGH